MSKHNNWTNSKEWVNTDPDNGQWGRKIGPLKYEFKEVESGPNGDVIIRQEIIALDDYSITQRAEALKAFGYSNDDVSNWDRDTYRWILAECIFELGM